MNKRFNDILFPKMAWSTKGKLRSALWPPMPKQIAVTRTMRIFVFNLDVVGLPQKMLIILTASHQYQVSDQTYPSMKLSFLYKKKQIMDN